MQTLPLVLIQTNLVWEDPQANLRMLDDKIRRSAQPGQVVFLPEMFPTGFTMRPEELAETMEGTTVQWMKNLAAEKKIILCGSIAIKEETGSSQSRPYVYYNRLIWMLPNGHYGTYDKRHLFAFAGEDQHYSPGNRRLIASVNQWKINLQICYDLRFPVWARQSPAPEERTAGSFEYDLLVYLANWPQVRIQAWRSLLIARAIENQCYVIGVNRVGADGNGIEHSGNSMIVDPLGEILYECTGKEDLFMYELTKDRLHEIRSRFPFIKDGDYFSLIREEE